MTDMNLLFFMVILLTFMAGGFAFLYKAMNNMEGRLKADINGQGTELNSLRTELNSLRTELKADIDGLRTELKADIDGLRTVTIKYGEDISEIRGILVGAGLAAWSSVGRGKNTDKDKFLGTKVKEEKHSYKSKK